MSPSLFRKMATTALSAFAVLGLSNCSITYDAGGSSSPNAAALARVRSEQEALERAATIAKSSNDPGLIDAIAQRQKFLSEYRQYLKQGGQDLTPK